jgi:diguanylate cyclase (GGDEF)-like protein
VATALLFASIDRTQPWSVASALLGIVLLGAVLTRQMGEILSLEERLGERVDQLSMVGDIIGALNSGGHVGGTLATALDRLLPAMKADAGAIWLPAADGSGVLTLVEQRNMPADAGGDEFLSRLAHRADASPTLVVRHLDEVPGQPEPGRPVSCLTVRMAREGETGLVFLARWNDQWDEMDADIVGAVGVDIGGALRSVRMISEARKLADRDPVTGLLNHRSAYKRLHQEVERHQAAGKSMAVLMMDLDNFKLFNDTYGHPAGDEVLKRVAGILRKSCREVDIVARYGGDEFIVLLPETSPKMAVKSAEKIQAALGKERFRCEDSCPLPIGFSYGVSVFPEDAREVQDLVAIADANLYQSKTAGGNRITARGASTTDSTLVYVKGFDLFRAMVAAIDNKDGYTRQHSEEVTTYSLEIAKALKLGDDLLQTIQLSGILHDVGKIGVPDAVLRKPGKLTDEEFDMMKQHPVFGALIVGAMPGMEEVVLGVRHHHERWDGRGYPDKLAGEGIPLIGRIMAIADAFSAMTTHRPYRKALSERQALTEVRCGLGTQFDPTIGALFVQLREERLTSEKRPAPRRRKTTPALVAEVAEPELAAAEA